MSEGYFLRIGDSSTCGGKILTGDMTFLWDGIAAAREGDRVTCGKYPGIYKIVMGVGEVLDEGGKLAGSFESFSSCPCCARFIPSVQDCYCK
ncbi:PAAR domain-containing protein [Erwinia sp. B116]|uniref:PAAR domain-containing protein n=1 Tax=Erwinia sp. B116 TaxID=1561024 RepID=UPI000C77AF13|nr:PAAR domain-containing protein [Erwinia sp. B116]